MVKDVDQMMNFQLAFGTTVKEVLEEEDASVLS